MLDWSENGQLGATRPNPRGTVSQKEAFGNCLGSMRLTHGSYRVGALAFSLKRIS